VASLMTRKDAMLGIGHLIKADNWLMSALSNHHFAFFLSGIGKTTSSPRLKCLSL
jgi:hypothetical protein